MVTHHRPHHRLAETIRLGDHRVIGNVDPFSIDANAVVNFRFCDIGHDIPIRVLNNDAISKAAAKASTARETVEPRFQWRIRIAAVIASICGLDRQHRSKSYASATHLPAPVKSDCHSHHQAMISNNTGIKRAGVK
jgi:hypothetical protein